MRMPDRRPAQAGEVFCVVDKALASALGIDPLDLYKIKPRSDDGDGGTKGQWICISCCVPLTNNLEKDLHCGRAAPKKSRLIGSEKLPKARHVLAWRCFVTGHLEVP